MNYTIPRKKIVTALTPKSPTLQTTDLFSRAVIALYAVEKVFDADVATFGEEEEEEALVLPRVEVDTGGIGRFEGMVESTAANTIDRVWN